MEVKELFSIGEKLGLSGDALRQWVDEEQALEREARAAEREAEREQAEWYERAERENAELEERIRLLRLRVREAEATLSRRAGPSEVTDRSAEGQVCTRDFVALVAERGDLDVYPAQFEEVTTVLEGVARRKVWPEDNLATAPSTLILHTQYTKTDQFEPDKAKKGFGSKNPTDSRREQFCYSASWRPNAVKEVSLPQNGSAAVALLGSSCNNGGCWEGNCKAVPTDASSAPLLEVAGDTTMAKGHLNKSLLMTHSFSVFGKSHTHLREQEQRADVLVELDAVELSTKSVFYIDLGMQDNLNDSVPSVKEMTDELAGQLSNNRAVVHCSLSIKQSGASSKAPMATEDTTYEVSRPLPAYGAMHDAGSWTEVSRPRPTRFVSSQPLRLRLNIFRIHPPNGTSQGKLFERGSSPSVRWKRK